MVLDNKGKATLLGEPFGTANNKLRKQLLFSFAGQLGLLECYRCHKEITDIATFSIEHKKAWSKAVEPIKAFYDPENIAFSHMRCNVTASNQENFKLYESKQEMHSVRAKRRRNNPEQYAYHLKWKRDKYNSSK